MALVGHRIASVYSAIVSGAPFLLPSSARCRTWLTPSWTTKRPTIICEDRGLLDYRIFRPKADRRLSVARRPRASVIRWPSAPVAIGPRGRRPSRRVIPKRGTCRRSSVITAACALLVRGWCAEGAEVVLDFPVSRRVRPESKTLPGMVAGVVPLVLNARRSHGVPIFALMSTPGSGKRCSISGFRCTPLSAKRRGSGQPADRVNLNFIPAGFTLPFGGVRHRRRTPILARWADFGLIFSSDGDQPVLSTAGAGQAVFEFRRRRFGGPVGAGVGGDDRRPDTAVVVDRSARCR